MWERSRRKHLLRRELLFSLISTYTWRLVQCCNSRLLSRIPHLCRGNVKTPCHNVKTPCHTKSQNSNWQSDCKSWVCVGLPDVKLPPDRWPCPSGAHVPLWKGSRPCQQEGPSRSPRASRAPPPRERCWCCQSPTGRSWGKGCLGELQHPSLFGTFWNKRSHQTIPLNSILNLSLDSLLTGSLQTSVMSPLKMLVPPRTWYWLTMVSFYYYAIMLFPQSHPPSPHSRSLNPWDFRSSKSFPRSSSQLQSSHCALEGNVETKRSSLPTQFQGQGRGSHHKL